MKIRKLASFWVSVSIGLMLMVVSCVPMLTDHLGITTNAQSYRRSESCDAAEGSVYPDDALLSHPYRDADNKYMVIFHCIGIIYMLIGLNTICDVHFSGALELMVEVYEVKPDVAGATFMAAGGSAPELFTSLVGVFAETDVGFGTIVGSAVFNVLFVIGLCGWFAKDAIHLTVWPLFRDCTFYIFGLAVLAFCASDEKIHLWEGVLLFCCYLGYLVIMWFNPDLEDWAVNRFEFFSLGNTEGMGDEVKRRIAENKAEEEGEEAKDENDLNAKDDLDAECSPVNIILELNAVKDDEQIENLTPRDADDMEDAAAREEDGEAAAGEEDGEEEEEEDEEHMLDIPEETFDKVVWYFCCPIYYMLHYTTPDPSKEPTCIPCIKYFLATFIISLLWIAVFSYLLVWWTEVLGEVIGIDTIIMGFTLLAAGTSIPDAVSSVHFAAIGEGDMAVSSSIGSNIFDILVGLPIPWMLKTGIVDPMKDGGLSTVTICSPYITFHVLLLLFMVFAVVLSIHFLDWKLNRTLGLIMGLLYLVFLVLACTVEFAKPEWLEF